MNQPDQKAEREETFNEGVMWEANPWTIALNYTCSGYGGSPCRHCHSHKQVGKEKFRICPRIIIVKNEGGCNSTGLCLDCVLDATSCVSVTQWKAL